ncbi:MAG: hypothetical protein RQM92_08405 [Candidatus Syntrophopropionicum ammoniitolerans]
MFYVLDGDLSNIFVFGFPEPGYLFKQQAGSVVDDALGKRIFKPRLFA